MKKFTAVIISLLLILPSLLVTFSVSAVEYEPPKLVYEPLTVTVRTGGRAVLSVTAEGEGLRFAWIVRTSEDGHDHAFYIDHQEAIDSFQNLDGKGKMKVSFKEEKLENNRVRHQLIIDNIMEFNYGAAATCTVTNESGSVECDTAYIYTSSNAPKQLDVDMIAEFSVRLNKLVKLSAIGIVPSGAEYGDDDIEYNWYQTPDGSKDNGYSLDEHDPVLMAEAYANGTGTFYYYCQIYVRVGMADFYYETGVTEMTVYAAKNIIEFDKQEIVLNEGEKDTVTVTATVDPEKDKGELTYQWYMGMSPYNITTEVPDATSTTLELTGPNYDATRYYTCVVNNHTTDDFDFDNYKDDKPYVKVVYTGKKGVTFTQQPKDVEVIESEPATFTVAADNAKSYQWYCLAQDGGTPQKLDNSDPVLVEGSDTPTLTVYPSVDMNGMKYFCEATSGDGVSSRSESALLTVKENPVWPVPVLIERSENVTAHVGDDVKIWVKAKAPEGAELECEWYVRAEGSDTATLVTKGPSLECAPDNTKEGVFIYTYKLRTVGGTKNPGEYVTDDYRVEFLPAETDSGAASGTEITATSSGDSETSGEGQRKGPGGLIIALLAVIGALVLALVGVGAFVLIKTKKKK